MDGYVIACILTYYSLKTYTVKNWFLWNLKRFFTSTHSLNFLSFRKNRSILRNHFCSVAIKVPQRWFRKKIYAGKTISEFRTKGTVKYPRQQLTKRFHIKPFVINFSRRLQKGFRIEGLAMNFSTIIRKRFWSALSALNVDNHRSIKN